MTNGSRFAERAVLALSSVVLACNATPKRDGPPASTAATAVASPSVPLLPPSASVPSFPSAAPSSTVARSGAGATMKLIDPGQMPRRKLRYTWRIAQKEQLSMDLRTTASTEPGRTKEPDVRLPSVHVTIAIDPQAVSPDGDLRYAWRVTSASVAATGDTPSQVADGMRTEVAEIGRLSGSALVNCRGIAKEVTADSNANVEPSGSGQMAEQIRQTLRDVAAPLPEEEVGVGARWRKLSRLDERDGKITQTETFRLVDLQDDHGALDDALAQTAPPQALRAPGMPPGTRARMDSMLASGEAKVRFDLARLVPQTTFDGTTTMVLSGQSAGDPAHSVRMVMHVFIAIAGSRR